MTIPFPVALVLALSVPVGASASSECTSCHGPEEGTPAPAEALGRSVHAGLACTTCHPGAEQVPHTMATDGKTGSASCDACHAEAVSGYTHHGRLEAGSADAPTCADCHGRHDILPAGDEDSRTHPARLADTCGRCHAEVNLIRRYDLDRKSIELYQSSVHGGHGGSAPAASCLDCHAPVDQPHAILWAGNPDSTICFFHLHETCGRCHGSERDAYVEGAHGQHILRGDTNAPLCTDCHGEHAIVATNAPESPVAPTRVAIDTCAPCHQSVTLAEEYGLEPGVTTSFFDSYHGMKSMVGDVKVADCADCHGAHRVLGPRDPRSRVSPENVQATCAECHPGISKELAQIPIHGIGQGGFRTRPARIVEQVYIVAIVVIIGLMVLHWLVDLARRLVKVACARPRVRRMRPGEVLQHTALLLSFVALVITGFALAYERAFWVDWLFGWPGGFELRRELHRIAAVVFTLVVAWHVVFLALTRRGRTFFRDMLPGASDFSYFFHRIAFNLGLRKESPAGGRFTYVEKAEYWALVWGAAVMIGSGLMLWFDNQVLRLLPLVALDVAWVVHFWEAWLATLAIAVWHMYSTVFDPDVYPMNPSWLTGRMPEHQYAEEHPLDLERARSETRAEELGEKG